MIKFFIACITFLLSGCSEYRIFAGTAAHSNNYDSRHWQAENPIGFIRAEANYEFDNNFSIGTVYQHESMIFFDDARGLNYLGVQGGYVWGDK